MKHTPGPWIYNTNIFTNGRCIQTSDFKTLVCEVSTLKPVTKESMEEKKANAHLIAAAPDMSEALEAWKKYDEAIFKRAKDGDYEITPRAAIAKGIDLDNLYLEAKTLMDKAIKKARGEV